MKKTERPQPGRCANNYEMEETEYVNQVKTLAESVNLVLTRFEQMYQLQKERGEAMHQTIQEVLTVLSQLEERFQRAAEHLEVTDEAHRQALDQLDGATDDIANATAGLLTLQQQVNAENAESQSAQ